MCKILSYLPQSKPYQKYETKSDHFYAKAIKSEWNWSVLGWNLSQQKFFLLLFPMAKGWHNYINKKSLTVEHQTKKKECDLCMCSFVSQYHSEGDALRRAQQWRTW